MQKIGSELKASIGTRPGAFAQGKHAMSLNYSDMTVRLVHIFLSETQRRSSHENKWRKTIATRP